MLSSLITSIIKKPGFCGRVFDFSYNQASKKTDIRSFHNHQVIFHNTKEQSSKLAVTLPELAALRREIY